VFQNAQLIILPPMEHIQQKLNFFFPCYAFSIKSKCAPRELNQITYQPYFQMPAFAGLRVKTSLRITSVGRRATSNAKSNLV